jgi:hypothetical protein
VLPGYPPFSKRSCRGGLLLAAHDACADARIAAIEHGDQSVFRRANKFTAMKTAGVRRCVVVRSGCLADQRIECDLSSDIRGRRGDGRTNACFAGGPGQKGSCTCRSGALHRPVRMTADQVPERSSSTEATCALARVGPDAFRLRGCLGGASRLSAIR